MRGLFKKDVSGAIVIEARKALGEVNSEASGDIGIAGYGLRRENRDQVIKLDHSLESIGPWGQLLNSNVARVVGQKAQEAGQ